MSLALLLLLLPAQVTVMGGADVIQSRGTSGTAELAIWPGVSLHSRQHQGAWFSETSTGIFGHTKRAGTTRVFVDAWALALVGDAAFGHRFGDKIQLLVFLSAGFFAGVGESRLVVDGRARRQGRSDLVLRLGPGLEAGVGGYRLRVILRGGAYNGDLGSSTTFSLGYRF